MQITIEYDSSWRNSFLDGSNNENIPKNGRKFIGSMTELKKSENYIRRDITKDTVMGILNRLIGEQAKLFQARQRKNYYFKEIEKQLKDSDIVDKSSLTSELIYIRNMSGSDDQNSFTGMVKATDPAFISAFSNELWSILWLDLDSLVQFILNDTHLLDEEINPNPLNVCEQFVWLENKKHNKDLSLTENLTKVLEIFNKLYPDIDYFIGKDKNQIPVVSLYCSAIYIQVKRLSKKYDLSSILSKNGNISGISKRGFTKKDFMKNYVTGGKKPVWGGAYLKKERLKGEGEVSYMLTKASGQLTINLDISREQALDLEMRIKNAGVSAFYLGKKGLAYLTDIRL